VSRTGAQIEDHAAAMARRFNALGIRADPGRFGGVVLTRPKNSQRPCWR
jgi:hypothetical protein